MAVPDTNTFTLANVCDDLSLVGANRNLVQAFAVADPAKFDPAYEGSKNSLLNFRNYGAIAPVLEIAPTLANRTSAAGLFDITVTSNIAWLASESVSWLSLSPSGGSGNGTITVTVSENTTITPRSADITVSADGIIGVPDQICEVNQAGIIVTSRQLRGPYAGSAQACSGVGLSTYYTTGGSSWATAEKLWLNSSATTPAGNGWYTDGLIARQCIGGVLQLGNISC